MDDLDELGGVLADAGFSAYQAQAYLGLLGLRDASVSELADACSVPRSRLYDVLEELEAEGYVETYEQDSLRARIADVTPAVSELRDHSEALRDAADEIEDRWERPQFAHSDISVFQTAAAAVREAASWIDDSRHTVQLCASAAQVVDFRETLRQVIDRDVTVRLAIVDDPHQTPPDDLPNLFPDVATEVRRCESNMPFVALVDGSVAALAIDNEWDGEYGLVVDDTTLTSILHWFFQLQLWEPWETLYSASLGTPTSYVSVREFIRDMESLRTDEERVFVRIEGVDTRTHEAVEIEGEVVDAIYTDVYQNRDVAFAQQFIQAALRVRTEDGEEVTIGGYGAVVEDIRAVQIAITSIE